jgi:hypothetical protein
VTRIAIGAPRAMIPPIRMNSPEKAWQSPFRWLAAEIRRGLAEFAIDSQ